MSLINDALKKASKLHQDRPPEAPVGTPMQPVETPAKPKTALIIGLVAALAVVCLAAVWLLSQGVTQHNSAHAAAASPPTQPAKVAAKPEVALKPTSPASLAAPVVSSQTAPAHTPAPMAAPVASAKTASPIPAPVETRPAPVSVPAVATAPQPVPPPAASMPVAESTPPVAPAPFPDLKLKAIVYRPSNATVFINSSTLALGDEIAGARIIRIEPRKVTVKWNGQTKDLFLE